MTLRRTFVAGDLALLLSARDIELEDDGVLLTGGLQGEV